MSQNLLYSAATAFSIVVLLIGAGSAADESECLHSDHIPNAFHRTHLIILGEIHGTEEGPEFTARLLCALGSDGDVVILGLEIPDWEQPTINDYLADSGDVPFRPQTEDTLFWGRRNQDGRSSRAMAELISQVKKLRTAGMQIDILAFDGDTQGAGDRDEAMALRISTALRERPDATVLVLTGNLHARKQPWTQSGTLYCPMANHLAVHKPLTFNMAHEGGTAWVCTPARCSSTEMRAYGPQINDDRPIVLRSSDNDYYDGYFFAGPITASSPAVVDQ